MKKNEADEVAIACAKLDRASDEAEQAGVPLEEDHAVARARDALQAALDRSHPRNRNRSAA